MNLSVIVVTYNSQATILECLQSVFIQKMPDVELIVIDNASKDETVNIIRNNFAGVRLICNKKNLGFSAAANQGIKQSQGKYVLFLNSDAILEKDFINKMEINMNQLPKDNIGMISPKILRKDGKIDSAGLNFNIIRKLYDRGARCKDRVRFNLPGYIFGPCGACAIYKRDMLENIKVNGEYFDEDFFLMVEDFDIAWRANLLGWKGWFMPEVKCYHLGGISRKRSKLSQYYAFRNRYFLLIKNEGGLGLFRLFIFAWIYDLPRLFYLLSTNRYYTMKALKEIKQLLPAMIKKRNFINRVKSNYNITGSRAYAPINKEAVGAE